MADAVRLSRRYDVLLGRMARLESLLDRGVLGCSAGPPREATTRTDQAARCQGMSPTQQRLEKELEDRGITDVRFMRVPADYYDEDLEFRRRVLGASSQLELCKSIVLENTRAPAHVTDCSDRYNSKYICVIVQYAARLNADKLKRHMQREHKEHNGQLGSKSFNYRLAPEERSVELTGYAHNAVTPVGCRSKDMPIVLSHKIAELQGSEPCFWLGAGEVDLKLRLPVRQFISAYQPIIVDCTYDEEGARAKGVNQS